MSSFSTKGINSIDIIFGYSLTALILSNLGYIPFSPQGWQENTIQFVNLLYFLIIGSTASTFLLVIDPIARIIGWFTVYRVHKKSVKQGDREYHLNQWGWRSYYSPFLTRTRDRLVGIAYFIIISLLTILLSPFIDFAIQFKVFNMLIASSFKLFLIIPTILIVIVFAYEISKLPKWVTGIAIYYMVVNGGITNFPYIDNLTQSIRDGDWVLTWQWLVLAARRDSFILPYESPPPTNRPSI